MVSIPSASMTKWMYIFIICSILDDLPPLMLLSDRKCQHCGILCKRTTLANMPTTEQKRVTSRLLICMAAGAKQTTTQHTKHMHEHLELSVESSLQHDKVVAFNSKSSGDAMNSAPTDTGMISSKQLVCPACAMLLKLEIQAMLDNGASFDLGKHTCHSVASHFKEVTQSYRGSKHNDHVDLPIRHVAS